MYKSVLNVLNKSLKIIRVFFEFFVRDLVILVTSVVTLIII